MWLRGLFVLGCVGRVVSKADIGEYMLDKGEYGKFMKVSAEVNHLLPDGAKLEVSHPLPKLIVVGMESAGKSSTLERIVGFPIFPRVILRLCVCFIELSFVMCRVFQANNFCTRMPAELEFITDPTRKEPVVTNTTWFVMVCYDIVSVV